ncbi:alkaline phosphatase D family protein [Arthrobacter sp. H14]|uniref:alkaline phosphatase D family protein n=1 Tax=Arthrobacter sp. H14 TaxID=1312959 RepID=UPI0009DFF1F1|nr:alkaline phosphatase D family protein [Arthrobacter sp. H14]
MPAVNASLILGPILRYVDEMTATVWVETSAPSEVAVLGRTSRTFSVGGHHYALVIIDRLSAGSETEYSVTLDGMTVWPEPDERRATPRIRTMEAGRELDIVFGSCRVDRPNVEPWTLEHGEAPDAVGVDALIALSRALQAGERPLPDLLLLLGDQIYADKRLSPEVREQMARKQPPGTPPKGAARNFDDYAWVYQHSWSQPDIRWLLSTVPSAMIFDDHEVRNHWNISAQWRHEVMQDPGWPEQIMGAYLAYWLYQHMGNLSPTALVEEGLWPALMHSDDGERRLREYAAHADDEVNGRKQSRWSYCRNLGRTRLVMLDTRSGRVLETGRRNMLSEDEWDMVEGWLQGDCDHLLIGSSLPFLLEPSVHDVEAWNEAIAEGIWGTKFARRGEKLRLVGNLEHWGAFRTSFRRLAKAIGEVAAGQRGAAPATVLVLSGDVHHSYVAHVDRLDQPAQAPVAQIVSSPLRSHYPGKLRRAIIIANSWIARLIGRLLANTARVPEAGIKWSLTTGPLFGNHLASLRLDTGSGKLRIERAEHSNGTPFLRLVHQETIAGNDARKKRQSSVPPSQ